MDSLRPGIQRNRSDNIILRSPRDRKGIPTMSTADGSRPSADGASSGDFDVLVEVSRMIRRSAQRRSMYECLREQEDRPEAPPECEVAPGTRRDPENFDILEEICTAICSPSAVGGPSKIRATRVG
ncbi:hypothetical protein CERSUDRAFT_114251 [Gelatoporia subvermispora B]|uniref:Uncharacterized protein n=1 Tax=Ceriporiopsis subvermispora (strain B) TaxID=914234 RepID=M2QKP8_CERS8|nr:hypothetical protein CERSUDRAFT_114251 [Gelatoporia subvermispora B]